MNQCIVCREIKKDYSALCADTQTGICTTCTPHLSATILRAMSSQFGHRIGEATTGLVGMARFAVIEAKAKAKEPPTMT